MSKLWTNVTLRDVLQAIDLFDRQRDSYTEARSTSLLYNNKRYPAKHIRGLVYKTASKKEICKNDYGGGEETAKFFRNLGFSVEYNKNTLPPKQKVFVATKSKRIDSKLHNFKINRFDPKTDSETKIANSPGNYVLCLRKNSKLPTVSIKPLLTNFEGLQVIYTGIAGSSLRTRDLMREVQLFVKV